MPRCIWASAFVGIHTLRIRHATNANSGEATGGSPAYARQGVTWATASGGVKTNSATLTFDVQRVRMAFSLYGLPAVQLIQQLPRTYSIRWIERTAWVLLG